MSVTSPAEDAPGRAWPVLGVITAVAVVLSLLVLASSSVRDRVDALPASTIAGPDPMRSLVLPEEFEGWTRATDADARHREEHPYAQFQPPADPDEYFSSVVYREYERGAGLLDVLLLTTVGDYRDSSARTPADTAHDFLRPHYENLTTMTVDDLRQGLVCGRIPENGATQEHVACVFYEDDSLLSVGFSNTALDLAGAAAVTRDLVEAATPG